MTSQKTERPKELKMPLPLVFLLWALIQVGRFASGLFRFYWYLLKLAFKKSREILWPHLGRFINQFRSDLEPMQQASVASVKIIKNQAQTISHRSVASTSTLAKRANDQLPTLIEHFYHFSKKVVTIGASIWNFSASKTKTTFTNSGIIAKSAKTDGAIVLRKLDRAAKRYLINPVVFLILSPFRLTLMLLTSRSIKVFIVLFLLLFVGIFYSQVVVVIARDLPDPNMLKSAINPMTTEIVDRNGKLLYRVYEDRNRQPVKLNELPPYLVYATLAIEDKNFYKHPGVDLQGITRAAWVYLHNEPLQGGSTITQQLIKNTLLTADRTWQRKAREMILAFWTEKIFTKDEILNMYFNEVAYGGVAWGVEAASQTYFDKSAKDLNIAEATYLAGLPASPTTYSPYGADPELAKQRQKLVLERMTEDGYITSDKAKEVYETALDIKPARHDILAPHFVMYTRKYLEEKYGPRMVSQGGLKVTTTLDLDLQQSAEQIVKEEIDKVKQLRVSNGAAMVTDPRNGHILAMVGSKDYYADGVGNYNVALALRQPGSSIKPITYATAFRMGYTPGSIVLDTPVTFANAWEKYSPVNYDGKFHGPVTIRTALGSSYNIPAVKMLQLVGVTTMIDTAKDMGITTFTDPRRYGLSLTLGGGEVRLIDMMSVYGTFAQNGSRHDPVPVLKVTDANGNILEDNSQTPGRQVLNPAIAYLITDILADNKARTPAFGPNSQLNIAKHTVAVKTGTTDNKKDNWTFGYTPEYVVGVWVGNNDNTPMDPRLTSGVTGASPIWNRLITLILKDKQPVAFTRPSEVAEGEVDGHKDLIVSGITPKSTVSKSVNRRDPNDEDRKRRRERNEDENQPKEVVTYIDAFTSVEVDGQSTNN